MGKESCRCGHASQVFLWGAIVLAMNVAAGLPLKADDETNPKTSGAKATLYIPLPERTGASSAQMVEMEYKIHKNTQTRLLHNPLVLLGALRKKGLYNLTVVKDQKDPVEWLDQNLKVKSDPQTEIVEVSFAGSNLMDNATIVNAVVEAYMSEVVDAERQKMDARISDLKRIQMDNAQEVKDSMNELRRMAESLGTNDSDTLNIQQKNALDELANMRAEFIRSQFELNRMRGELVANQAELQVTKEEAISDIACELYASSDPVLKSLQQEILQEEKIADSKILPKLKEKYSARLAAIREAIRSKNGGEIEKKIKRLEAQINVASKQSEISLEEVKKLRKEADRFGLSTIDMQMRREDIKNRQKSLDSITAELDTLRLESNLGPRISVLQKPEVPE
jgi:polysaccharide biosynthesis transport protein